MLLHSVAYGDEKLPAIALFDLNFSTNSQRILDEETS